MVGELAKMGQLADANLSVEEQESLYELLQAGLQLVILAGLAEAKEKFAGDYLLSYRRKDGWGWASEITLFEAALERIHTRTRYIVRVPDPEP